MTVTTSDTIHDIATDGQSAGATGLPQEPPDGLTKTQQQAWNAAYQIGADAAEATAPDTTGATPPPTTPAGTGTAAKTAKPATKRRTAKGPSSRRRTSRRSAGSKSRTAARQAVAPLTAQAGNGIKFLTLSLMMVALYDAVSASNDLNGFLGFINKGLAWFSNPNKSVPYRS